MYIQPIVLQFHPFGELVNSDAIEFVYFVSCTTPMKFVSFFHVQIQIHKRYKSIRRHQKTVNSTPFDIEDEVCFNQCNCMHELHPYG